MNNKMKFSQLLLYIGVAFLAFWVISIVMKIAGWFLHFSLFIGLVLIIGALISGFFTQRRK